MKYQLGLAVSKLRAFLANRRGVAAVEFALILPVMVVIYLATVEISMAIGV